MCYLFGLALILLFFVCAYEPVNRWKWVDFLYKTLKAMFPNMFIIFLGLVFQNQIYDIFRPRLKIDYKCESNKSDKKLYNCSILITNPSSFSVVGRRYKVRLKKTKEYNEVTNCLKENPSIVEVVEVSRNSCEYRLDVEPYSEMTIRLDDFGENKPPEMSFQEVTPR